MNCKAIQQQFLKQSNIASFYIVASKFLAVMKPQNLSFCFEHLKTLVKELHSHRKFSAL